MKTTKLKYQIDSEGTWLAALVNREDAMFCLETYEEGKEYEVEVKKARGKKRSLDMNAYCWVLMDKLAVETRQPVTDVYRNFVRDIGGNSDILCMMDKAVDSFRKGWEQHGIGWQTEIMPSKIEGCTCVKVYYGSSTYDTKQMSKLIDLVIAECKEFGIETMPPAELERLLNAWDGR